MKTAVVILGMHRSATSALAGCLVRLGLTPPRDEIAASDSNPKGHFESTSIARFNDRVLTELKSCWFDWRAIDMATLDPDKVTAFREEGVAVLGEAFGDSEAIVLKDPRICRLVPLWRGILTAAGFDVKVVLPVRLPGLTAQSLNTRNGFSYDTGRLLWLQHVLAAERDTRDLPRHVVLAEDLVGDAATALSGVIRALDLDTAAGIAAIEGFVEAGLIHHDDRATDGLGRGDVAGLARDVYDVFGKMTQKGDKWAAKGSGKLDRLAGDFAALTAPMEASTGDLIGAIAKAPGARHSMQEIIENGRKFREQASQRNLALRALREKYNGLREKYDKMVIEFRALKATSRKPKP